MMIVNIPPTPPHPADCSGTNPLEGPLKREMDQALAMAERFTQQYNSLLRRLEERMANTSLILDMLNREFGWVSSLANRTNTMDNFFQIQTVRDGCYEAPFNS